MAGVIQRHLPRHCYVGQRLLEGEDVSDHALYATLIDVLHVLDWADQDFGYQVSQAFEYVLKMKL